MLNPTNFLAYHSLGVVNQGLANWDKAIECYTRAIELDSKFSVAYADRGSVKKHKADWVDVTLKRELQPWIEKAKAKLQNNKP